MVSRVLGLGMNMAPTEIVAFSPLDGLVDVFQPLLGFKCLSSVSIVFRKEWVVRFFRLFFSLTSNQGCNENWVFKFWTTL